MDATRPEEEFERDKAARELVVANVQKMLDLKFPGAQAEQEMGRAYPQSNAFLIITIKWPPVPPAVLASPSRRAKHIGHWWLSGAGKIDRQPGQPETLPPSWHYITIEWKGKRWLNWIVIGPKSRITKELLGREIETKTGKKVDVIGFHVYDSTYKRRKGISSVRPLADEEWVRYRRSNG